MTHALAFRGGSYTPTQADKLWLSRAVEAEGPVRLQVARALVNLFALLRSKGDMRSLADVVRAYAQPVNPRWFPTGDLFLKAYSPPTPVQLAQAERRRDAHATRTTFSSDTKTAVEEALSSAYASDITDYAAPTLDATKKGYVARSWPELGVNRLWTRSVGWPGYAVDGATDGWDALIALMALALAVKMARGKT